MKANRTKLYKKKNQGKQNKIELNYLCFLRPPPSRKSAKIKKLDETFHFVSVRSKDRYTKEDDCERERGDRRSLLIVVLRPILKLKRGRERDVRGLHHHKISNLVAERAASF